MNGMVLPELQQVDTASAVPRYVQAKSILIDAIRRGTFRRGSKLPNTSELSACLSVSLITAHKAIQGLVAEGWVDRVRGRGTYVRGDFEASVAAKSCYRIGLLLDRRVHLGDYYHAALFHGLREAACADEPGAELFIQRQNSPAAIPNLLADGFICLHPFRETFAMLEAVAAKTPIMVLGGSTRTTLLHCVDSENEEGARQAVRHLIDLGHRDIAILNGRLSATNALDRFNGYVAEMRDRELPIREEYLLTSEKGEMTPSARGTLTALLRGSLRPTAIVAGGYLLALEVLEIARHLGLRIPEDLSLVGFDDTRSAALLNPSLTTVRQPLEEMARLAMERMIALINHTPAVPRVQYLPTTLIVRESTARVPAKA